MKLGFQFFKLKKFCFFNLKKPFKEKSKLNKNLIFNFFGLTLAAMLMPFGPNRGAHSTQPEMLTIFGLFLVFFFFFWVKFFSSVFNFFKSSFLKLFSMLFIKMYLNFPPFIGVIVSVWGCQNFNNTGRNNIKFQVRVPPSSLGQGGGHNRTSRGSVYSCQPGGKSWSRRKARQ